MVNYLANFPFLDPFFLHFWQIFQNEMLHFFVNGSKSLSELKAKIKKCNPQLSMPYLQNIGFIWTWRIN